MSKILETIIGSILTYVILLILGRAIGRKLILRITFFDFIVGITLGSIAVRIALGSQESPFLAGISAVVITTFVVITDYLDLKSISFRKVIDGEPIVLINNGRILDFNLKKARININKLTMQLREKNIFNIEDVAIALIESDGELTLIKKADKEMVTTGDLNITSGKTGLMQDIIIDGRIMYKNLKYTGYDEKWIKNQLEIHNISNDDEIFYAGLNGNGTLYISKKTKQ